MRYNGGVATGRRHRGLQRARKERNTHVTTRSETATKHGKFQAPELTPEMKKAMHDRMVASRVTDEVTIKMNRAGQGFFWIGGPGEEAFGACLGFQVKKGQG